MIGWLNVRNTEILLALKNRESVIFIKHTKCFVTCALLSWYWRMRGLSVFHKTISFLSSFPSFLYISNSLPHLFPIAFKLEDSECQRTFKVKLTLWRRNYFFFKF